MSLKNQHQIVLPHTIFVGDTGEVKISFSSEVDFFNGENTSSKLLSLDNFMGTLDDDLSIKNLNLTKTGISSSTEYSYNFSIQFVAWKTGEIKFPDYKLENLVISADSVQINSILEQKNVESVFQPEKGPLLIPGTTYKLYARIILLLILLVALIRWIVKWKDFSLFIKNQKLKSLYKKNRRSTEKKLSQLLKSKSTDKEIAGEIQNIMRNYLQIRFDYPFTIRAASEISIGFDQIFQGLLSEKKQDAVDELVGLFIRTDFIRYGDETRFENDELSELIKNLFKIISVLESTESAESNESTKSTEGTEENE